MEKEIFLDESGSQTSQIVDEESIPENKEIPASKKLDYTIESPEERRVYVNKLIAESAPGQLSQKYLEILSDYIVFAMDKQERKEKKILTDNRMVTVNKRETSYQGLVSKFENGEDGLWNLIISDDKNVLLTKKDSITEQDIAEIKPLQTLKENISAVEEMEKKATGKKKFLLKKQLIEMHQEQYVIKEQYKPTIASSSVAKSIAQFDLAEHVTINEDGEPVSDCLISFFNPKHISALLCNYSAVKEEVYGKFSSDTYYMMEDLDRLIEKTLRDNFPLYYKLLIYKIDGRQNIEIQELLEDEFGIKYSVEYISSLWRNKIPKLLAEKEKEDYLIWHYTNQEHGVWKRCSRCGEVKLANNKFFSKNSTSKDGYYSICKCCRNKKDKGGINREWH